MLSHVQVLRHHGLYSLPGSSAHGIPQARILEWVAAPRGSFQPRNQTWVSCIAGRFFTANSATPWTVACQASLSSTISWSLLKLMSIESVMPSNHLTLCHPLLNWCEISFWRQGILPYIWGHEALWGAISYKQEHTAGGGSWGRVVFCCHVSLLL